MDRLSSRLNETNPDMSSYRDLAKNMYQQLVSIPLAQAKGYVRMADVAIFHEFRPPPAGGGHQFLRALWREWERQGYVVENNTLSRHTRACLFNSYNFSFARLRRLQRDGCRMVHRVDGPMQSYRGFDNGSDDRVAQINAEMADATIFQSRYSLQQHMALGFELRDPHVILNVPDPTIFHPQGRLSFDPKRKIRLISVSWSDNPNKGAPIYEAIAQQLDWDRFEYTFVGNAPVAFEQIHAVPPVTSMELAKLLREHDIYITASKNDPCSNSLLEALACGLPALYLDSGGHPEIVGNAGFAFLDAEEAVAKLDELVKNYVECQVQITLPTLEAISHRYLQVMQIAAPKVNLPNAGKGHL